MFFKKKENTKIVSPVSGKIFPVEEVSDAVFSEEMMGQTISIHPVKEKEKLVAPIDGILEVVYPSGHAYAIRAKNGTGFLVHIGIDTVELNGEGFIPLEKQGNKVKAGQEIVEVDFNLIKSKGYEVDVMLIVTESAYPDKISFQQNVEIAVGNQISL